MDVREGKLPTSPASEAILPSGETVSKPAEGVAKSLDRRSPSNVKAKKAKEDKKAWAKGKKKKKKARVDESSSSETTNANHTSSEFDSETTSSESDSDSEAESRAKHKAKKRIALQKSKRKTADKKNGKKSRKSHQQTPKPESDSSSDSDSGSDSDSNPDTEVEAGNDEVDLDDLAGQLTLSSQISEAKDQLLQLLQLQRQEEARQQPLPESRAKRLDRGNITALTTALAAGRARQAEIRRKNRLPAETGNQHLRNQLRPRNLDGLGLGSLNRRADLELVGGKKKKKKPLRSKRDSKKHNGSRLEFKRVDQVWDKVTHNYELRDTAERPTDAHYDEYLFHIRRTFDWEGKFKATIVDIKSKPLRECLQEVMGNIKGVSLVEEIPRLDPNMLFLYLDDFCAYRKQLKKKRRSGQNEKETKKERKRIQTKRDHLKVLIKYLNKDYAVVKNSLYPMLENGLITFDLLWALWKPSTLAYTTTYGSSDEPRVFKVEVAEKHYSIMKGDFYIVEGKYLEYDGKQFGHGGIGEELGDFKGARKITSLGVYPLKYHKNETQLRKDLVERGKKFVGLGGVHYKTHQGLAYYKKKKAVIKVNINGRIMVDPAVHRRINPNYPNSTVRPKDHDMLSEDEDEDEQDPDHDDPSEEEHNHAGIDDETEEETKKVKYVTKAVKLPNGKTTILRLPKMEEDDEDNTEKRLDDVPTKDEADAESSNDNASQDGDKASPDSKSSPEFSDEDYLMASPVVLGFAFAEKLWLEFTVSGVKEIQWNENAYQSLVLESKTKAIVKALVESHKYHAAESIDDVIQGKGKGLVAVLHGPPGTGKTLTAEGISELLNCPLYMASAGELGTDSRFLETELQKILDVCHAWGAILLLDEADVFLEKRNMHDIHRNALVSIFLRQLEYFQGILFLTTNRVEDTSPETR